jgi:hypothetical protein
MLTVDFEVYDSQLKATEALFLCVVSSGMIAGWTVCVSLKSSESRARADEQRLKSPAVCLGVDDPTEEEEDEGDLGLGCRVKSNDFFFRKVHVTFSGRRHRSPEG